MGETVVVNVALVLRVLLVGGILIVLPRITRKGLLFGAYVGEEQAEKEAASGLLRAWFRGCLMAMALALLVGLGISAAGRPLAGNLTGTGVLLIGALLLYLRVYRKARALASPSSARQAAQATASLLVSPPRGATLAKVALGVCVAVSLGAFVFAIVSLWGPGFTSASIKVLLFPAASLVVSPLLALMALLTARAKRSLRGGSGGRSLEAQEDFRATMSRLTSAMALLFCGEMTLLSVWSVRGQLDDPRFSTLGSWLVPLGTVGATLLAVLAGLAWLVRAYGQGGARLEDGTTEAPLTNGLADNSHWVFGLFYVDKLDPSILVEKRFGIGYTFNYGNRTALLIVASFFLLSFGLVAAGVLLAFMGAG